MQEEPKLFRESTLKRISSPEQLNDYVRVTNPGIWLLLAALFLLLAGALIWGFFGEIKTTKEVSALVNDGTAIFYCENSAEFSTDMEVYFKNGASRKIESVSTKPISREQVKESYGDYVTYELDPAIWTYAVQVPVPAAIEDGITKLSIVIERVKPISFILN